MGIVVELIRDYDGEISKNLQFYIKRDGFATYQKEWEEFKSYLITENILIGNDVTDLNILVKRVNKNQSVFVLVDSLGDHVFIPVLNFIDHIAKQKIIRRLARAEEKIRKRYQ